MTHPLLSLLFPQTLMLVSSTTRPLLGCVWNFPSTIGLAYATTSLVIHEMIPIILMAITNLTSLYTLYTHGRNPQKDAPVLKRVPAEKRAAKVRKKGALEVDEGVSELCKLIFKCNKLLLKNVNALPQRKGHQLEKGQLHIHTVIKRILPMCWFVSGANSLISPCDMSATAALPPVSIAPATTCSLFWVITLCFSLLYLHRVMSSAVNQSF